MIFSETRGVSASIVCFKEAMTHLFHKHLFRVSALILAAAGAYAAQPVTEIVLPGKGIFPESITSTSDGTLIVGSLGHGNVSRIAPGKTAAEEWIKPGTGGLNGLTAVWTPGMIYSAIRSST